jgi:D-glucosaminate-6-phosphate ammonia-lyase
MKRRDVIKGLTLLPIAGGMANSLESAFALPSTESLNALKEMSTAPLVPGPLKAGPQIYESIGVRPVINGRGTLTMIGASIELPEVREAMEYAARQNVQLDELAMGVGQRLAEITGAEWGMVSSGCAAGLKHVASGCITGGNPEKLIRIPDLSGMDKTEVIIPRSMRNFYDHGIRNTGLKVIMPETLEELDRAISSRTALIYLFGSRAPFTVEAVAKVANPKGVTILVDAAAEKLTIPNVHLQAGATVVAYSGGKILRGPQCAGLLLGKKDVIMAAWHSGSPHHGTGRDNKVGREEIIGMLAAVESWAARDFAAEAKMIDSWVGIINKKLSTIPGVKVEGSSSAPGTLNNASTRVTITWDPTKLNLTSAEAVEDLAVNPPRIALGGGGGGGAGAAAAAAAGNAPTTPTASLSMSIHLMTEDQVKIAADRLYELLTRKRTPKPFVSMKAPASNISGRWDVEMQFFAGKSNHTFYIEKQEGNYIQGTHKGDFHSREMRGTIDGDQIKFTSSWVAPGDALNYIFWGTASGDTMSGDVHMGEYMTAKFTAKRYTYPNNRAQIIIPTGPPFGN